MHEAFIELEVKLLFFDFESNKLYGEEIEESKEVSRYSSTSSDFISVFDFMS